jgi:hypothetical protein
MAAIGPLVATRRRAANFIIAVALLVSCLLIQALFVLIHLMMVSANIILAASQRNV